MKESQPTKQPTNQPTSMLRFNVTTVTMVVMAMVGCVRGAFNEPDWGFQSYLNESFTLICDRAQGLKVEAHNHIEWTLPNGQLVTQNTGKYVLISGLRGTVFNMQLTITNVQERDAGVYLCHVYNNIRKERKLGQLLRGLNLGGHKYREPFDEYRDHLMVGGIAAVVLFVPLVAACLIYKFRYQTQEDRAAKHAARLENTRHQRHLEAMGNGETTTELSEVSVSGGRGESNPAYNGRDEVIGTRL
ncbi:hypothetical protein ACOMHN_033289 [Nucella lapillus]